MAMLQDNVPAPRVAVPMRPPAPLQTYPQAKASHEAVCRDSRVFYYTLNDLLGQLGISLKVPKNGGKRVDLHRLYVEVTKHGGLQTVIARKLFVQVCEPLNFPATFTNKSTIIRKLYCSMLHHYEQVYFFRNEGKLVPPPDKVMSTPTKGLPPHPLQTLQAIPRPQLQAPPPALPLSLIHLKPSELVPALIKAQLLKTLQARPQEIKPADTRPLPPPQPVHPNPVLLAPHLHAPTKLHSPRDIICAVQLCELAQHEDNNASWESDAAVQLTPTTVAASQLCDLKNNRVKPTPVVLETLLSQPASIHRVAEEQFRCVAAQPRPAVRPDVVMHPPMPVKPQPTLVQRPVTQAAPTVCRQPVAPVQPRPATAAAPQPGIPAVPKPDSVPGPAAQAPAVVQGIQVAQPQVRPVPNNASKPPLTVKQRVLTAAAGNARPPAAHMVMPYKEPGMPSGPPARPVATTIPAPRTSFPGAAVHRIVPHPYMTAGRPHTYYHHPSARMDHSMMGLQPQPMHYPTPGMMYPQGMVPRQVVYVPYGYYAGAADAMGYY